MIKSVVASLVLVSFTLVGCGKKKEEGAKEGATPAPAETAKPSAAPAAEPPPAAPAAPSADTKLLAVPTDTGVAECDAIAPQIDKFNGCAKIAEDQRMIVKMSVDAVPQVADAFKNEKEPAQKDINKTALGAACKSAGEAMTKAMTAAGC